MGGISSELRDAIERDLQPIEHVIEGLRKALQFVAAPREVKPLRKVIRVDLLSRSPNLIDRGQGPPAQPVSTR